MDQDGLEVVASGVHEGIAVHRCKSGLGRRYTGLEVCEGGRREEGGGRGGGTIQFINTYMHMYSQTLRVLSICTCIVLIDVSHTLYVQCIQLFGSPDIT